MSTHGATDDFALRHGCLLRLGRGAGPAGTGRQAGHRGRHARKPGRGVGASYVARTYGVHSAMPAVTATGSVRRGSFLPPRIDHYTEISGQFRGRLRCRHDCWRRESAEWIARQSPGHVVRSRGTAPPLGGAPRNRAVRPAGPPRRPDGFRVVSGLDRASGARWASRRGVAGCPHRGGESSDRQVCRCRSWDCSGWQALGARDRDMVWRRRGPEG
jgi:hypothetical protein